jgi:hypothetical protein
VRAPRVFSLTQIVQSAYYNMFKDEVSMWEGKLDRPL